VLAVLGVETNIFAWELYGELAEHTDQPSSAKLLALVSFMPGRLRAVSVVGVFLAGCSLVGLDAINVGVHEG
jgi:hypothetical protein